MRTPAAKAAAALICLSTTQAWAHGIEAVVAPAAWGGIAVGAVAGLWSGSRGGHPGVALGWSIGILFVALVAWAGLQGELLLGAVMYLFIVPFAGVIPLAIAFFVTFAASGFVRERFFAAAVPPNEHEH